MPQGCVTERSRIVVAPEQVAETVMREVARIFKTDAADVSRETRFVEDLNAKSLNIAQLIAVLEDDFGISIPFMEARRRRTVGEAIDFVTELRQR
jgi:acyl carrier protein